MAVNVYEVRLHRNLIAATSPLLIVSDRYDVTAADCSCTERKTNIPAFLFQWKMMMQLPQSRLKIAYSANIMFIVMCAALGNANF